MQVEPSTTATSATPRLEMRGMGKSFGGVAVLSDVDLVVAPGEVVSLLGSNGAGKSTLVKILTGVYTRDAGTVKVDLVKIALGQFDLGPAAAMSIIYFLIILAVCWLFYTLMMRSEGEQ